MGRVINLGGHGALVEIGVVRIRDKAGRCDGKDSGDDGELSHHSGVSGGDDDRQGQ